LRGKYLAKDGGPGIYRRLSGGDTWRKTQSISQPAAPQQTTTAAPTTSSQTTTQQPNAAATSAVSATGTPGLQYVSYANNKELSVSAGTARGAVVIPATYDNLPVTRISSGGFANLNNITEVIIPNSVKSIGDNAFAFCTSLTSVTFQGTITSGNFGSLLTFPGDLRAKYLKGGPGTYTRPDGKSNTWTKQ